MVSSSSVLHSSQVVSVGAWITDVARADKQASPAAWQGLKHLQSCHSVLFLICPFLFLLFSPFTS